MSAGLPLPEQKNYDVAYGLALHLAGEKLASGDIAEICRKSGTVCDASGRAITVRYFNRDYRVSFPDFTITAVDGNGQPELRDKVLILDYLGRAGGAPLTGKLIGYQELAEGAAYYPSFIARAVRPITSYFGRDPEKLVAMAETLDGVRAGYGDAAVTVHAFSRVPITIIVWRGDDEFPADSSILFDETVLDYLSPEDINVVCQSLSWGLVKSLKSVSTHGPEA